MILLTFAIVSALLFAMGAAIGSFLNVIIYRSLDDEPLKKHETWTKGRSRCDNCHQMIHWYDNIPVVSYLLLRGKCRNCASPIAVAHPVLEVITGALFVWWYWGGSLFFRIGMAPFHMVQPLFWLAVGVLLVFITMADILYFIIPDSGVALLTILTVGYRAALVAAGIMQPQDLAWSVAASLVVMLLFGGLWLVTKGRGLGLGDVKLIFPLSLLVGWPVVLVMLFFAFLSGAVIGVILISVRKKKWRQPIPFGPFLIGSACFCLIWGEVIWNWYTRTWI